MKKQVAVKFVQIFTNIFFFTFMLFAVGLLVDINYAVGFQQSTATIIEKERVFADPRSAMPSPWFNVVYFDLANTNQVTFGLVDEELFENLIVGERVVVKYRFGRITNRIYVQSVSKISTEIARD